MTSLCSVLTIHVPALDNWSSQDYDLDSSSCPYVNCCSLEDVSDLLTSPYLTKSK